MYIALILETNKNACNAYLVAWYQLGQTKQVPSFSFFSTKRDMLLVTK